MNRDNLVDSMKVMPGLPSRLETNTILMNSVTVKDILKFTRDNAGGDLSQDMLLKGWSEGEVLGARLLITIKSDLVLDGQAYFFADPKFIGKFFLIEDTTMYVKREAYMLEFFAYETVGATIGHTGGLVRVDYN